MQPGDGAGGRRSPRQRELVRLFGNGMRIASIWEPAHRMSGDRVGGNFPRVADRFEAAPVFGGRLLSGGFERDGAGFVRAMLSGRRWAGLGAHVAELAGENSAESEAERGQREAGRTKRPWGQGWVHAVERRGRLFRKYEGWAGSLFSIPEMETAPRARLNGRRVVASGSRAEGVRF
jgi:hypothetical protein